jgi:hypothetical protein
MGGKKYNYIYKTTCIITNRFYIGMHSTDNLEDGYIGSGKRLWHSINKHGKENHICEILEFLPDRKSLAEREREIVNQEMLNEELCMNITTGGEGGYNLKAVESNRLKKGKTYEEIFKTPEMAEYRRQLAKDNYSKSIESYNFKNIDKNKHFEICKKGAIAHQNSEYIHSEETKSKIKDSNKNRDWSDRKTEDYRNNISIKTKEAMSKLDNKFQEKALESRLIYWSNKRIEQINNIIELQNTGNTPKEIRVKLNISYHVYNSRIKEINTIDKSI